MSSLNDAPRAVRLHIGLFGRRNVGKSSLVNALTGHDAAIVSPIAGTTTDPVSIPMEIHGLGPCVFIDTAGFDDEGAVGEKRVEKTALALEKTDVALLVLAPEQAAGETPDREPYLEKEQQWLKALREKKTPVLVVLNKADTVPDDAARARLAAAVAEVLGEEPLWVSAPAPEGPALVRERIMRVLPEQRNAPEITGGLAAEGDLVLLVMPQDIQAPRGRLILPQVQTLRELLDKRCLIMSTGVDTLGAALAALARPPRLIITDSQAFAAVHAKKPAASRLTSFSVLMAGYKGDIGVLVQGAKALATLGPHSRILIAEACAHAPLAEDIGREKIPAMLRKRHGSSLQVAIRSGTDFPADLTGYDLIIHCGGCMFNRAYMLSRIERAREQGVPITNYGVAIAELTGILDAIDLPC